MSSSANHIASAKGAGLVAEVIIPVKNDWERLALTLTALEHQSLPQDSWRIIVVDNGSTTPVPPSLRLPSNARLIREDTPGSYAARNAGIRASNAPFLAFTDADCLPDERWLQRGLDLLIKSDGRVAGEIHVFAQNNPPTSAELHEIQFAFTQRAKVARGVAATANLFVSRASFESVGLFDERLQSGGDIEWNRRASRAGIPLEFAEDASVRHPARATLAELLAKDRRVWSGKLEFQEYRRPILLAIAVQRGVVAPLLAAPRILFGREPVLSDLGPSGRVAFAVWMILARLRMLLQRLLLMGFSNRTQSATQDTP